MVGGTGIDDDDDAEPVNRARALRSCLHGVGRVRIPIIILLYRILYYNGQGFENVFEMCRTAVILRHFFFNSKSTHLRVILSSMVIRKEKKTIHLRHIST